MSDPGEGLVWASEDQFTVRGTPFAIVELGGRTAAGIPIFKTREMVEAFVSLVTPFPGARIVELGIWAGGSTALLAQLLRPSKLVAVDLASQPAERLETFLDREELRESTRLHYGVDQADSGLLARLVADEFGDDQLDLVIDDASHLPGPTRASFATLFPRLRRDGLFVLEDWAWEHAMAAKLVAAIRAQTGVTDKPRRSELLAAFEAVRTNEDLMASLRSGELLSDVVAELVVAKSDGDTTIGEIAIEPAYTSIRRGPASTGDNTLPVADRRAGASRVLHLGPLDDRSASALADLSVRELVLVNQDPPDRPVPGGTATMHVAIDPAGAPAAEVIRGLGDARFDLVIDGSSSDTARTRLLASTLLGRVPAGGRYVIAGWPRLVAAASHTDDGTPTQRMPLLLLELILSVAEWGGAIDRLILGDEWLTIHCGDTAMAADDFDIAHLSDDHFDSLSRT